MVHVLLENLKKKKINLRNLTKKKTKHLHESSLLRSNLSASLPNKFFQIVVLINIKILINLVSRL